ncbi:hypothetical protein ACLBKT_06865 [Erythrobacter sp. W302b]|uniref:hypothetical protein n=1 Tax=Erythrobacter sp. W302b TaxID=3389874 RepID=UPI00396B1999
MTSLEGILQSIDWKSNCKIALSHNDAEEMIRELNTRIAVWSKQLEIVDFGNPALSFVREMQASAQMSGALVGLCLYKASAAASRSLVESCLYYSYFRTHPEELATLANNEKFYISKQEIIEYHKLHTVGFVAAQGQFGLVSELQLWYSQVSAVVHGQVPGTWGGYQSLSDIGFVDTVQDQAMATLLTAGRLANDLLLCTVSGKFWASFAPDAKQFLLKGMAGSKRQALGLDAK